MRRFVAAIIVLALTAAAAVGSNFFVKKHVETLTEDARALVAAGDMKDKAEAGASLDILLRSWEKADTVLHMFVVHREMNELELNIHALEEYLEGGDWELFREGSVRMLEALAHIRHSQRLSLRNVF